MKSSATWLALALLFYSQMALAVRFEPGVGLGLQYTDNVSLSSTDKDDEIIGVGYVGARMVEDQGALTYEAAGLFNHQRYTQNTFSDQNNLDFSGSANWAMIKDRFNWFLRDVYTQRTVRTLNSNTPNNLEDNNIFTLGADIQFPISVRQHFSLQPKYDQYYYETQTNNNRQYALSANWNYQMFRLTNVGLNLGVRKVNYMEKNLFGQSINDITFTNAAIVFTGQRLRSSFSLNLGATKAEEKNASTNTGFSGSLDWLIELTSRSEFQTLLSTDLTDTSSAGGSNFNELDNSGEDVQIAADVVRTNIVNLTYVRRDALLDTRISARYNELKYRDLPLDRVIKDFDVVFNHPVTSLLTSSVYLNHNRSKQVDTSRLDKRYTVGGNLSYNFTRKLYGTLDLEYRRNDSPAVDQDYTETSIFASMVYGFGQVQRPSQTGGF